MNRYLTLILLSIVLSGCGAMGKKYNGLAPVTENESLVYVYRPSKFFQGGTWPTVFIDGEDKFLLKDGGYVYSQLTSGHHTIKIGKAHFFSNWAAGDVEAEINVEPSNKYFFKLIIESGNIIAAGSYISISGSVGLIQVSEEVALDELKVLKSSM